MSNTLQILRIVIGTPYVLFLPGFALSFAFFRRGKIDIIERVALSFALSISVVPLVTFYLNLLGVRISFWSIVTIVAVISAASAGFAKWRGNLASSKPTAPTAGQHKPHKPDAAKTSD